MTVGVNSWISLADANTYFSQIKDGAFWASLTNSEKEILLMTSFYWINRSGYSIAPTSTSILVKQAQCELTIEVHYRYTEYKKRAAQYASGLRNFNFNGWAESLALPALPLIIENMLEGFLTGKGGKFFEMTRDY
jgi:hypothetical protein